MSVIRRILAPWLIGMTEGREPNMIIGGEEDPYLIRWFLIPRNRLFNVYLHLLIRDDDDRALHDHPWWNLSIILSGAYIEHSIEAGGCARVRRTAGEVKLRRAVAAHRLELDPWPCWTLFITGPKIRTWGFHCPNGWRRWQDFTAFGDSTRIGVGCSEAAE